MHRSGLACGLLVLAAACGGYTGNGSDGTGKAQIAVSGDLSSPASKVQVTVSAPDFGPLTFQLAAAGSGWSGIVGGITAGQRHFDVIAFNAAGAQLAEGSADAAVVAGQTTSVAIVLSQNIGPVNDGSIPIISSLVISTQTVAPGKSVQAVATAHDPDPLQTLTYQWTAAQGTFATPTASSTTWTAPATTTLLNVVLTVTAKNGEGHTAALSTTVAVDPNVAIGGAGVTVGIDAPLVSAMQASAAFLTAGQPVTLTAVVSNAAGRTLTYAWTSSCSGTGFGAPSGNSIVYTLPASATGSACTLTVRVSDAAGSAAVASLTMGIGSATVVQILPIIDLVQQSATTVPGTATVNLAVFAHSPAGKALHFSWTASAGTLAAQSDGVVGAESSSKVQWTVTAPATASATVTDDAGTSTVTVFSVSTP